MSLPIERSGLVDGRSFRDLAAAIDHTLLKPEATAADVAAACAVGLSYRVAAVCVRPCDVLQAGGLLAGSDVAVCTVIGFPHGTNVGRIKVAEALQAIEDGAQEVDMVMNVGYLKARALDAVRADIEAVAHAAHDGGASLKVILENALLSDEEKILACRICEAAGADYVKTSTGFAASGSTVHDLRLMRGAVSAAVRIKAAGGIRTLDAALESLAAGADRLGASATVAILDEFVRRAT